MQYPPGENTHLLTEWISRSWVDSYDYTQTLLRLGAVLPEWDELTNMRSTIRIISTQLSTQSNFDEELGNRTKHLPWSIYFLQHKHDKTGGARVLKK
jgi:hypothetical protein